MILQDKINELSQQYDIISVLDLDPWHDQDIFQQEFWLRKILSEAYQSYYKPDQRIILTLSRGDTYQDQDANAGSLLMQLQRQLDDIDISNYFVILLTIDVTIAEAYETSYKTLSHDDVLIKIIVYSQEILNKTITGKSKFRRDYRYNSAIPVEISMEDLSEKEQFLLTESPTFCIYPWLHLHSYPTGSAYPCCQADMKYPIGNLRQNTMKEIWNDAPMKKMRQQMLNGKAVDACTRCYEQEASGFLSGRQSANKHHGHHINLVKQTQPDGTLDAFKLTYWDIRFSNLCNLRCRSCGHIFSSSWYQDQAAISNETEWKKNNQVLNYAGRYETDAWEQLVEHIDHVEAIYFAGGEPLLMDEHYRILDELVRREKFDVRLVYNTNFTHTRLKDRSVFEYWKLFDSVSIGASLDDSGPRAEYIRKGTDWAVVEQNRQEMIQVCPEVDFYISPTLSIMNAWHLPDFHRDWVERGLIRAQDLNINILQDPPYYRIDIAPAEYKERLATKFLNHIKWLQDKDQLSRATQGFESAIKFMMAADNTDLIDTFWRKTHELDDIRKENILTVIPELTALK
jgi:radical SAM protein with 4Fe4S-binding SPASM domain